MSEVEAASVAGKLVRERVRAVAAQRESPPVVRAVTRDDVGGHREDATLNFDWRNSYAEGRIPDGPEMERLRDALGTSMSHLKGAFTPGAIDLELKTHLHVALAVGHALRRPTGYRPQMIKNGGTWIAEATAQSGSPPLAIRRENGSVSAARASVEISVSRDISRGVDELVRERGEAFRQRIQAKPQEGPGQMALSDGAQANEWARQIVDEMARVRTLPGVGGIDLFMACPLELAVLLGWWLNAAGPIRIYHWSENAGPYIPAWTLPSS